MSEKKKTSKLMLWGSNGQKSVDFLLNDSLLVLIISGGGGTGVGR